VRVAGKAGNLAGNKIDGGNVFEGSRKREYPNPPMIQSYPGALFEKAVRTLAIIPSPGHRQHVSALHQFRTASRSAHATIAAIANASVAKLNAKASAHFTVIPLAAAKKNVEIRTELARHEGQPRCRQKARRERDLSGRAGREFEQRAAWWSWPPMRSAMSI